MVRGSFTWQLEGKGFRKGGLKMEVWSWSGVHLHGNLKGKVSEKGVSRWRCGLGQGFIRIWKHEGERFQKKKWSEREGWF